VTRGSTRAVAARLSADDPAGRSPAGGRLRRHRIVLRGARGGAHVAAPYACPPDRPDVAWRNPDQRIPVPIEASAAPRAGGADSGRRSRGVIHVPERAGASVLGPPTAGRRRTLLRRVVG